MRIVLVVVLLAGTSLAGTLCAQYPASANALRWTGTTSTAGPFCWGFSCRPEQATVVPGETGTLMVRGEFNQIYALGVAPGASRCMSFPSIYNSLVLDDPIVFVRFGVCSEPSPILACPSGWDRFDVRVPPGLPRGASVALQALVSVPSVPGTPRFSFSQTIVLTVM